MPICPHCGQEYTEFHVKDEATGVRPYFVYMGNYFTGLRYGSRRTAEKVAALLRKEH